MADYLIGVRQKLDRAQHHLDTLHDEIGVFLNRDPISVSREVKKQGELARLRLIVHIRESPPLGLSTIIGDCLHNLRCALDYLVYDLSRLDTGKQSVGKTFFPIATNVKDFRERGLFTGVRLLTRRHRTMIYRLQPYRSPVDPSDHPLAVLNAASNRDKHRLLHATFANITQNQPERISGAGILELHRIGRIHTGRVDDKTPLFEMVYKPDPASDDVKVEGVVSTQIAFGDDFPLPSSLAVVKRLIENEVLACFAPEFPT